MSVFHSVMSLLPTTRINTLTSTSSNSGADTGLCGQDEDILLVDFQPIVVSPNPILSSPSTTTSTAMYPLPPPQGGGGVGVGVQLPSAHMIGLSHQASLSSDGITTPISATGTGTGSSGKAHSHSHTNPNNFSLVSLSNHAHHNNNTSREESDLNYPPAPPSHHHLHYAGNVNAVAVGSNMPPYEDDDEDDEFARHQALAQPSYMLNKRRSRRFTSRDSHIWDNANHIGHAHAHHQHQQAHLSSSLSSSEDSDTGFLMGTRKTAYTRRSVQRVVDPHPPGGGAIGPGNLSPSATTGLLPNLGSRKRVRRRRPSARNRKPTNNQRDKIPNPSDVLSLCCCFCEDDNDHARSGGHHRSSRNRYFRLIFVLIAIIVIAVLASITVSLQRKVDSLDSSLRKLDQVLGSPLTNDPTPGDNTLPKPQETLEALKTSNNELNQTVVDLKLQLNQTLGKLLDLQKQLTAAMSKQEGVSEVRGELAKLGSRVQEMSATMNIIKGDMDKLKKSNEKPEIILEPISDNDSKTKNGSEQKNGGSEGSNGT